MCWFKNTHIGIDGHIYVIAQFRFILCLKGGGQHIPTVVFCPPKLKFNPPHIKRIKNIREIKLCLGSRSPLTGVDLPPKKRSLKNIPHPLRPVPVKWGVLPGHPALCQMRVKGRPRQHTWAKDKAKNGPNSVFSSIVFPLPAGTRLLCLSLIVSPMGGGSLQRRHSLRLFF